MLALALEVQVAPVSLDRNVSRVPNWPVGPVVVPTGVLSGQLESGPDRGMD